MATRLLIIHQQLIFAVTIKQALEQTGLFDVHPFTTPGAAVDYLRGHPQDVALVDFALPTAPGALIVQELRDLQPDIAVIATPDHPDAALVAVQAVIDPPFTARDLVPVIQQAAEQSRAAATPPPARRAPAPKPPAQAEQPPAYTRIFDDEPAAPPATTRQLDDQSEPPATTHELEDQWAAPSARTRLFDDIDFQPPDRTRIFEDAEPAARAETESFEDDRPVSPPAHTRAPDDAEPPEFSSLDKVLRSFDFDPLVEEEDTPSVPERGSDAMRQYLATASAAEPHVFDEILGAIEPGDEPGMPQSGPRSEFDELVESMRGGEPHKPLPERQPRSLDFVLTSGMDEVLKEIEKAKTGPLTDSEPETPRPDSGRTFTTLAQEEPPMPALEESGTVSDLMTGIGDNSFRNVLAMLRGEDEDESPGSGEQPYFPADRSDDVTAVTDRERPAGGASPAGEPLSSWWTYEETSEEESVAHVVLKTTLDQPPSLPLDEVMTEIESRLAAHRLTIKPLPSWDMDTGAFRPMNESGVLEPDFLPEELPPGEMVAPPPDLPEFPPSDASSRTTRPSPAVEEAFEPPHPEADTVLDMLPADIAEPLPVEAGELEPPPDSDWPPVESADLERLEEPSPPYEPEAPAAAVAPEWLPELTPEPGGEPVTVGGGTASSVFIDFDAGIDAEWPFAEETVVHSEAAAPEVVPYSEEDEWLPPEELPEAEPEMTLDTDERSGWTPPQGLPAVELEAESAEPHDPVIAQLALNLTQASLELTAEATLLTRDGDIVASAGHLGPEDTSELLQFIAAETEMTQGARFRFISLPSSGRDYMLYSIQTTGGLILSMIFAGTTPLRVIRRQAQKLVEALAAVPEVQVVEAPPVEEPAPQAEPVPETPAGAGISSAYATVWLLRDPDEHLSDAVAQSIIVGLTIQLQEHGWVIHTLQVHEDFVYLLADVPGERPPHEIIRELMRRSADIAHAQDPDLTPQMLWADSYLVLAPGRELQTEEILEFINFQRLL